MNETRFEKHRRYFCEYHADVAHVGGSIDIMSETRSTSREECREKMGQQCRPKSS